MEEQQQPPVPVVAVTKPSKSKPILVTLLVLLLIGAAGAGAYYWQHQKVTDLQSKLALLQAQKLAQSKSASTVNTPSPNGTYATAAYPLSVPQQKVTLTLSLPKGTYVLPYTEDLHSGASNDASVLKLFAASYNDIIGRFFFGAQSFIGSPSQTPAANNYLYASAMSKWAATADPNDTSINYALGSDVVAGNITVSPTPMTVAEKSTFVSQLSTNVTACSKETGKGFVTSDKSIAFCYEVQPPRAAGGTSILNITGYASLNNQPVIIVAVVSLATPQTEANYLQALKATTISAVAI